ncbi:MAG: GlsB/YeaQ/YmgE family stress response membrane protein [Acaryochloris sp. RU_4_1]|nr:GlsB/YeaQ/YmgE family stress response membrane protein [Acaryochloris sp. RU_4_1]NJR56027.1 GlsB/YeaQ/YmgE family stress response membrane protein [Acaryochloris sp. CRU_2_0]
MNIIAWIILGLLAGAIAKAIYPGSQGGGILSTMILGVIGAFIGGSLLTLLQTGSLHLAASGLSIPGVFVAVLGAIIAIFLWGLITRSSNI